jgi:hypothetical protein
MLAKCILNANASRPVVQKCRRKQRNAKRGVLERDHDDPGPGEPRQPRGAEGAKLCRPRVERDGGGDGMKGKGEKGVVAREDSKDGNVSK